MLPRTARTARHEGARCDNARSPRHTTMRTKHCHAGRPELTRRAHIDAKPGRRERTETAKKLLCRLTLELSGGEAVRLERDVMAATAQCTGRPTRLPKVRRWLV